MERASRIVSILLGLGVTFLLWPVAVPLGFGEVWWASQKAQWQSDAKPVPPAAPPQQSPRSRSPRLQRLRRKPRLPSPRPRRRRRNMRWSRTPPRPSRLNRHKPTPRLGKLPR